jgi:inner membrane protein
VEYFTHAAIGHAVGSLYPGEGPAYHAAYTSTMIVSVAPDMINFVWRRAIGRKHFEPPTHTLPGALAITLAASAIGVAFFPGAAFWPTFGFSLLGMGAHFLTDFMNTHGTRGLWPLVAKRFRWDLLWPADPVLALCCLLPALLTGYTERPAAYLLGLVFAAAWITLRIPLRAACLRAVRNAAAPGATDVAVLPGAGNLNRWTYIITYPDRYAMGVVRCFPRAVGAPEAYLRLETAPAAASKHHPKTAAFLAWSRFPWARVEERPDGYMVTWTDLQFSFLGRMPLKVAVLVQLDTALKPTNVTEEEAD